MLDNIVTPFYDSHEFQLKLPHTNRKELQFSFMPSGRNST